MNPGADALAAHARKLFAPDALILDLSASVDPLAALAGHAGDLDGVLAAWPTRSAPLMPFLNAVHGALKPSGAALVLDLVWQTAPTPELIRAFAPQPGRDKLRPIEGYEMQIEHAGFRVERREDQERASWAYALAPEERAAVEADARGAAKLSLWILRPEA